MVHGPTCFAASRDLRKDPCRYQRGLWVCKKATHRTDLRHKLPRFLLKFSALIFLTPWRFNEVQCETWTRNNGVLGAALECWAPRGRRFFRFQQFAQLPEVGPAGGGGTQLAGGPPRFVVGQQWGFKSWDLKKTPSIFPSEAESKYIQIYPNPRNSGTSIKIHENPSKSIKIHKFTKLWFCKLPGWFSEPFWLQGCRPFLAAHWHVPGARHANPCWLW